MNSNPENPGVKEVRMALGVMVACVVLALVIAIISSISSPGEGAHT